MSNITYVITAILRRLNAFFVMTGNLTCRTGPVPQLLPACLLPSIASFNCFANLKFTVNIKLQLHIFQSADGFLFGSADSKAPSTIL
jgi:hypothetical protein